MSNVSPATPAPVPMEYKVLDEPWYPDPADLEEMLNTMGADGWDLQIAIRYDARERTRWIFKR